MITVSFVEPFRVKENFSKALWSCKVPGRVKFHMWLSLLERFDTIDVLSSKNIHVNHRCYLCNAEPETFEHLFLNCEVAKAVWRDCLCYFGYYNRFTLVDISFVLLALVYVTVDVFCALKLLQGLSVWSMVVFCCFCRGWMIYDFIMFSHPSINN